MTKENAIRLFNDHRIRVLWNDEQEKWFFSIVDVIEVLTGSDRPRKYWSDLKRKLKVEGSQLSEKIGQLKMLSADGKYYNTDIIIALALKRGILSSEKITPDLLENIQDIMAIYD